MTGLCHSLLDLLLEEIKNIPSAGYMANLAQKLNRFIVKDSFDKFKKITNAIRYHGQAWTDLQC
jgi:hypothetical protein